MARGLAPYPLHKMFSDKNLRPFNWLSNSLYNCRGVSTNRPPLFKTKPISRKAKMNAKPVRTRDYVKDAFSESSKNKANQTQFPPDQNERRLICKKG